MRIRSRGRKYSHIRKNNCSGMTMVEVMVAFALMGILFTASLFVITTGFRLFGRVQGSAQGVIVSNLVLNKIIEEIEGAQFPEDSKEIDSKRISLIDKHGRNMEIYAAEPEDKEVPAGTGYLVVHYEENGVLWEFEPQVYGGQRIQSLTFSREDPTGYPDVIHVEVILENEKTGIKEIANGYAKCYNFAPVGDGNTREDYWGDIPLTDDLTGE